MRIRPLLFIALPLSVSSCQMITSSIGNLPSRESRYLAGYGQGRQHDWKSSPIPDDISYWEGDNISGSPMIKISRPQQKAFFYKNGILVGVARISTGKEGHDTPSGTYKVTQKDQNYRSGTYGVFKEVATGRIVNDDVDIRKDKAPPGCVFEGARMPNFLRFNGGVGMHTGYLPGYAASHGCVRMPDWIARKFFEHATIGTPVIVE